MNKKLFALLMFAVSTIQNSWGITQSSVQALDQVFLNAPALQSKGLDIDTLPTSQQRALEELIESRYQSGRTDHKVSHDLYGNPIARYSYDKNVYEVRREVYEEIEEGTLQYKSGFSYGWHIIAGTPTNYFRAILLAPLGLLFGIATAIAGLDGWL